MVVFKTEICPVNVKIEFADENYYFSNLYLESCSINYQ
jgi:hypothetical protein